MGIGIRSVTRPLYHTSSSSSIDCRDHRLRDSNHDPRGEEQEEEELEMEKNELKTILHDNHIGETERERERDETRRDKTVKLDTPSRLRAFAGSGVNLDPTGGNFGAGRDLPLSLRSFDPARFSAFMARASHNSVESFTHNEKTPFKCLVQPENHEHRSLVRYLKF